MTSQAFANWMKSIQGGVEEMLAAFLPSATDVPARLHEAMRYAVLDGGKRVRPLLVFAAGELSDAEGDPERRLRMLRLLASAAGSAGMCGGQAIDLASVGITLSLAELEQMHRLKTGALLRASVLLGALCGKQLDEREQAALDQYANAIGLAFQVVDDVLDATEDSATLGKTAGKDAVDNKPTYVSILGLEQSRALAESLCRDAHRSISIFGDKAQRLRELADLIVQRNA